jgi:hypothetical protein
MNERRSLAPGGASRGVLRRLAMLALLLGALVPAARAKDHDAFEARGGLVVARACAAAWAEDAYLVYLENDEPLDPRGAATRWGYLFFSPSLGKARGYSVRDGKILVAENLEMKFEAPPVSMEWIDSGAALQAAEQQAGRAFCHQHGGHLKTMLLMRGALHSDDPDETTWMVVYASPRAPSLFVVVDGADGKVRRTWRG